MTPTMSALTLVQQLPQALRFVLVGGSAAATHLLVVWALVQGAQWAPLWANGVAFLVAFWVSYGGHALLTFAGSGARHRQALPRFFVVACSAFAINELLYLAALRWLPWHYLLSLLAVLLAVAVGTFVSSKLWAFARPAP